MLLLLVRCLWGGGHNEPEDIQVCGDNRGLPDIYSCFRVDIREAGDRMDADHDDFTRQDISEGKKEDDDEDDSSSKASVGSLSPSKRDPHYFKS